jgi:hypothetical protein
VERMSVARCWTAGSGAVGCLGDDDVVRDATIEEMSQAVFSASPLGALGGYIFRPTKLGSVQCSAVQGGLEQVVNCEGQ